LQHTAVIVDDEIDDAKTDTFSPFLSPTESSPPVDFIDLITFQGDEELQRKCRALCYKYKHIFSDTLNKEPADIPPFDLKVDDAKWRTYSNRGPVRVQTPAKDAEAVKHIQHLLKLGIIVASTASFYSQIIIASKPDDYRRLNDCTDNASWPIPNIKSLLARIGTMRSDTFGVMDLTSGYHQAPLTPAAMLYTAFICYAGIYHFTRLPFGPKRAPSYFQEQMASVVLAGLIYYICEMYVDDCIVHGKGNDQFLERLELIFQRFSKHNILLQPKKCKFGMSVIEYVGRQISKEGTSMSPNKIKTVVDFPKPTTNTALRSFLGLANYMRDFVRNHSTTVAPLHAMVDQAKGKSHPIKWTPEGEAAFIDIKRRIDQSPLLYFDDESEPITLMTDASDYGIGGHLFQTIKGAERTIAFVSKSLTETQLRWSVIQKEAYAIFYCVTHLGHILRDRTFIIRTDHKNLTFMSLDSNAMVIRWNIALQEFNYTLEYVPGHQNTIADTLSRLCVNRMITNPNSLILSAIQLDRVISAEHLKIIQTCHSSWVGHGGVERTVNKIHALGKQWRYCTQDVRKFIAHCPACQKMSQINMPIHAIKYIASTYHTMECLNIDFVGPYPDKGYVLVIIDTFTRWIELYPSEDATANAALEGLLQHFGRYGCPRLIRSDRGPHFANELIKGFLKATGTPHNLTLAYSSEENAIVERSNKEVNRHITAYTFDNETVDQYREALPFVQRIMNSSHSQRTKISPADLLFGKQLQLDRGILLPFSETPEDITPLPERVATMLTLQARLVKISQDLLQASDAKHLASTSPTLTEFAIGTHVLVAYEAGPPTRLLTRWRGPMKILNSHKSEYLLLDLVTGKEKTVHIKNMRIFHFDPLAVNPLDIARRDYSEYFVEKILEHKGDFRKVSTLVFKVRWLHYTSEYDTWEPWKNLRHAAPLHEYLRSIGKAKLIPTSKLDSNSS
jgi:RNase H-like domain found in reverse transcriptase/Reverse transcriptase (RNA-dependent DNA polymerase)/Integrase core domain/Integrase zinc binding domain/Chromo (CHRromatin Organisation MOdifier) domain